MKHRVVYWGTMPSPLGLIAVAAVESGALSRVAYGVREEGVYKEFEQLGPLVQNVRKFQAVFQRLDQYFQGVPTVFNDPVDLSRLTVFQRRVLQATRRIPYGAVTSYGDVAEMVRRPGAARAVGNALRSNPLGIVIPCHRVVARDGSLGGFSGFGGVQTKRFLLDLERKSSL